MGHRGPCSEVITLIIKTEKKGKYKSIWHIIVEYVAALEAAEKSPISPVKEPIARRITNSEELKTIMLRGIEKWSKK